MTDRRHGIAAPGAVKQITSLANPAVKDLRALAQKKHRDETGLFLGEGFPSRLMAGIAIAFCGALVIGVAS